MNTFGAKLRSLRKQKGLSQEEAAKLLGYSRVQVSNWEIERSEPDIQALGKLAEFYGVTIDSITETSLHPADETVPTAADPVIKIGKNLITRYNEMLAAKRALKAVPTAPITSDSIGDVWNVPEQLYLPIIGVVRAGPGGIAFEEPTGYATVDKDAVPNGSRYFYLRVKGESMSPEIMPGDLALVREQPEVEYGELAVVIVDGEEGTIKRVFPKNGEIFLQATNPSYNRTEKANNVKIVGKVKQTVRKY